MSKNPVNQPLMLTASDIKQFVYCPRIVYFRYVLPVPAVATRQMEAGRDVHIRTVRLDRRRTTRRYQLRDGKKVFGKTFVSKRLGLTGSLDLLIEANGDFFPVEYKYSSGQPALHHRYQLTAYALLVEDSYRRIVRSGYVNMIRDEEVYPVEVTESKKARVKSIIQRIRNMIQSEQMPDPTPHRERCRDCEYRLFCADTV